MITNKSIFSLGEIYLIETSQPLMSHKDGKVFKLIDPTRRGNPVECQLANRFTERNDTSTAATQSSIAIVLITFLNIFYNY